MARLSPLVIEKYRRILQADPGSLIFAALADAYRENQQLPEAETLAREGIQRHPQFSRGLVVLGRILHDRGQNEEALALLEKAIRQEPDNLLAHQIMGDIFLNLKNSREALRSYKKVLFLNPLATKARKVVEKLESQTASEYEEETFAMAKIPVALQKISSTENGKQPQQLLRLLSLVDAFIARNDFSKAMELVQDSLEDWNDDTELQRRLQWLKKQTQTSGLLHSEGGEVLQPSPSRTRELQRLKAEKLQALLQKVQQIKADHDNGVDPLP